MPRMGRQASFPGSAVLGFMGREQLPIVQTLEDSWEPSK